MTLKHVAIAFFALLVLAITWRLAQSEWAQGLNRPADTAPRRIEFDNGTVRQYDSPASVAARNQGQPMPLGTLRKCQRGTEVSYTNSFCPPGAKELKVDKGTLNIVDSGATAAPPKPATPGTGPGQPGLRELAVERAVRQ